MSKTNNRADEFVAKVEAMIEAGEFTPDIGYLTYNLGPCGCAVAAGCFLVNRDYGEPLDSIDKYRPLIKLGLNRDAVEAGYEGGGFAARYFKSGGSYEDPSYLAGVELSKFYPNSRQ